MSSNLDAIRCWIDQEPRRLGSRNVHSSGPTIYNYGQQIAQLHDGADGRRVCLTISTKFSTTTTGIQNAAEVALSEAGIPIFTVPDVTGHDHAGNHAHIVKMAQDAWDYAQRPRVSREDYERQAWEILKAADRYNRTFGLGLPLAEIQEARA